ncbi:type VII secretion system-associated protein [Streptomyces sp. NPDC007084]|uniref:type VII secretion system-associated protein n=1 Tax=Streptomyces sp. NPDC007084 TaxID=3154313 RepID=UPI003456BECD
MSEQQSDPAEASEQGEREHPEGDAPGEEQEWPQELLDAAKIAPDHWIRMIDPAWNGDGEPPEWAVGGVWRSDEDGNIVEGEVNEDYKPSPAAMGWPPPIGPLDEAVQLAATGYITEDTLARELAASDVLVFVDENGEPALVRAPDGSDVVAVSADAVLVDEEENPHVRMPVEELLRRTNDEWDLYFLSPSAPVSIVVPAETLLDALAERRRGGPRTTGIREEAPAGAGDAPAGASPAPAVPEVSPDEADVFEAAFTEVGLEAPRVRPTESGAETAAEPEGQAPRRNNAPRRVEDLELPERADDPASTQP